ncbi:MAG: cobalamin biosynthesis protein CbiD [Firmicutes bacterium]|nr:cobalamin biosynthesis protein CbiD [Bacillota bacterium]
MKQLKSGFTTGTCAALAARAAVNMIFLQKSVDSETVITPKGTAITAEILNAKFGENYALCAVRKDAGDDSDVTNGILIYTKVTLRTDGKITVDGGEGIGRVTKKGLKQNIGEAAINPVPRRMLAENVSELLEKYGCESGADILVYAPEGAEIAKKTFNPRLGIVGGISILGTSGIVEPMSEQAIVDTIDAELSVKRADGAEYIVLAPGNYGIDYIRENAGLDLEKAVKCSNFVGQSLDLCVKHGFKGVLLVGHIGKFVKLAGNIMNTHSKYADCRMEIIAANTALFSDDISLLRNILNCATTDAALELLDAAGLLDKVMQKITDKAAENIKNRVNGEIETGIIIFTTACGERKWQSGYGNRGRFCVTDFGTGNTEPSPVSGGD